MMSEPRSWSDKSRHFASKIELLIGCFREQGDHQVLQRDHADEKLHQFGVCQLGDFGLRASVNLALLRAAGSRAALVIPP